VSKVKFNLTRGHCIGNYRLIKRLGSGFTAEAYLATEVPTMVKRVVKLYAQFDDNQRIKNLRNFEHYCWFLEELADIHVLPRYYHMGHTFLRDGDGIGHYFMVQEYLEGKPFTVKACTEQMVSEFRKKVQRVHDLEYALGDFAADNLIIVDREIRMVDCDYGKHDAPNTDMKSDIKAMATIFGAA